MTAWVGGMTREELVYMARLAKDGERYEEMMEFVMAFATKEPRGLSTEERRFLLHPAFKGVARAFQGAIRGLRLEEQRDYRKDTVVEGYRTELEEGLKKVCLQVERLVETHLIRYATDAEAWVFYRCLQGDCFHSSAHFPRLPTVPRTFSPLGKHTVKQCR